MEFEVKENVITAFGVIEAGDGVKFGSVFSQLEQNQTNILLKLHTDGGSVFDGNMIYNALINSKANVTIHIIGIAASMGAIISLAVENVYMAENGYIMIHAPSSGNFGTANDLENSVKLLRLIEADFIKKLQQKTGKSTEYVQNWLNGDTWFNAEQALNEGLIKGVIKSEFNFEACNPRQLSVKEVFNHYKKSNNFNNNTMELREILISKLKLRPTSSDTKIVQEVEQATDLRNSIIQLLELKEQATDEDILNAIKSLQEAEQTAEEERETEARYLITQAIRTGGIVKEQEQHILSMFKKDFAGTKRFLNSLPKRNPLNIIDLIQRKTTEQQNEKPKSQWNLQDYRKHDPKELERNPKLYQRLIKEMYNK